MFYLESHTVLLLASTLFCTRKLVLSLLLVFFLIFSFTDLYNKSTLFTISKKICLNDLSICLSVDFARCLSIFTLILVRSSFKIIENTYLPNFNKVQMYNFTVVRYTRGPSSSFEREQVKDINQCYKVYFIY